MLSKNQIKLIKSLSQKKFRNRHKLFVVEGIKGINEFLKSDFQLISLFATEDHFDVDDERFFMVKEAELKKISFLKTPQEALAVFKIPKEKDWRVDGLNLTLDGVRDPGNLGTIIRLCDWFGVENLICSKDTVDCYNPKVVQASMGSLTRVDICYTELPEFLSQCKVVNIYGAFMDGESVYSKKLSEPAVLVMGNEANGISAEVEKLVSDKISIPQFGKNQETESLNVAMATSILLSEFRRSSITEK